MLGKLLKYDMKSISRTLIPLWILAPVVSFLFSLSVRGLIGTAQYTVNRVFAQGTAILSGITTLVFFGVMVAILVMTILFIIQRFWNGLLKEEGYLMFTLPVETWELVISKGLCATVVSCISLLVGIVSCAIMVMGSTGAFIDVWRLIGESIGTMIAEEGAFVWSCNMVLFVVLAIVGTAESVYRIYASMALGQLFEGHRVVGACVAYIGIGVVWSVLSGIGSMVLSFAMPESVYYFSVNFGSFSLAYLIFTLVITAVQIVVWHLITVRILSRHLNLE